MSRLRKQGLVSIITAICIGFTSITVANAETVPFVYVPNERETTSLGGERYGQPRPEIRPYGIKGFLIKQGLRLVSSMLRNGRVREIVEAARERRFVDDDMARAIETRPNQIADAIDNTLREVGDFENGIKEKLRVNLEPIVGQKLALGIAEVLMFVFL